jgi:tetratricopeptide (TPR) repeat protein
MWRALAGLMMVLAFAGVARADDWAACDKFDDADPSIRACTRIITAGRVNRQDLAAAYNNRGLAYDGKGDHDGAIADYDKAIQLNPAYAIAFDNRGYTYEEKGDHDRAIADYDVAIRLDPKKASDYDDRGLAYEAKGDHDRAIADYDKSIQLDPKVASTYDDRGLAYEAKGDHDGAIADYDNSIQLDPKNASTYQDRGDASKAKNDYDGAIADYTKSIELDSNKSAVYNGRGLAYDAKGDHDDAIADYDSAIRLDPNFGVAYDNRGYAYDAKGDHGQAIKDYDKSIALNPNYSAAYNDRGVAYEATGDHDHAIADETEAIRLKPDDGYAYFERAGAYAAKDDAVHALIDYRVAVTLIPESDLWHSQALTRIAELEKHLAGIAPPTQQVVPKQAPTTETAEASSGVRVALVIGNSAYSAAGKLPNPEHDAAAIAAALTSDGFEVTKASDVTRADFIATLNRFADVAAKADWAVIYFAGHGLQLGGVNYLIPVDAKLAADRDVEDEAIPLDRVMSAVAGARKFGLIVVDACRNNPFLAEMQFTTQARATRTRGLARIEPQGTTLVEFSARDGQEAQDGDPTGNSPFAAAFAKLIATPGLEVGKLLRQIRADVRTATGDQQEPMFTGNIPPEDMFFRPQ